MLTDAQCKAAKPRRRQYVLTDANGLELLVTPKATKVWRFRYRIAGRRARLVLGRYPTLGLAAARAQAAEHRTKVWRGEDPGCAAVSYAKAEPLEAVLDLYVAEHLAEWPRQTADKYTLAIEALRTWAASAKIVRAADLTTSALASFRASVIARPRRTKAPGGSRLDTIETDTPRTPNAINSELRAVKTALQSLRKAGRLPSLTSRDAIADNLEAVAVEHERPDPLRPSQLRDLVLACQRHDAAREHAIGPFVLTCLLTGMRIGEVFRLTWADVDLDDQTLRVVVGKTKRERIVDLHVSPALVRLLASLPRRGARVFDHTKKTSWDARYRLTADYGAPAFLYSTRYSRVGERSLPTLRSTCGSYLACAPSIFRGASLVMSAAQLGHSVDVAQRHYLGTLRRIPASATTLESAMGIADLLEPRRHLRAVD